MTSFLNLSDDNNKERYIILIIYMFHTKGVAKEERYGCHMGLEVVWRGNSIPQNDNNSSNSGL